MSELQAATEQAKPARVRLEFLDGFRGIAAVYVALYHLSIICMRDTQGSASQAFRIFHKIHFGLLFYGNYAVVLFIVLSGFCLTLPYVSRGEASNKSLVFRDFMYRRFRRMCPPYFVALLISSLVCYATGWDGPFSGGALVTHVLMVHNFTSYVDKINAPMWSVALEFQIYIVFALLLFPVWRKFGLPAVLSLALVLGIGPMVLGLVHTPTSMLTAFALGMAGAIAGFRYPVQTPGFRLRSRLLLIALGVIVLGLIVIQNRNVALPSFLNWSKNGQGWILDILFAAYCALLFARCTVCVRSGAGSGIVTLFQGRVLAFLGAFSYSIYLYHSTVLGLLATYAPHALGAGGLIGYYFGFGLLLILGVAYLSYLAVERHFLNSPPAKR